jgi:hypothetical protein
MESGANMKQVRFVYNRQDWWIGSPVVGRELIWLNKLNRLIGLSNFKTNQLTQLIQPNQLQFHPSRT